MILDKEDHRKFLIKALEQIQYPWNAVELAVEIKHALENASIETDKEPGD